MSGSGIEASAMDGWRGWRGDVAGLVGRVDDALRLRRLLLSSALVTVVGPGGVGKTRLAAHVAPPSEQVTWVHLATVQRSNELEQAVAAAFHLRASGAALVRAVAARFAEAGHVLVLDNAEHLVAAVAELAHAVVATCPTAHILCTSRELLRIPGEVPFWVAPLDDDASTELFVRRSQEAGGEPGDDVAAIVDLCRRLDGLPLAIELAASRTRALRVAQIAADLRQRFALGGEGHRVGPPHQRTLESSIEWSVALLERSDRAVLRRLSVFEGPFTAGAAQVVVGGDGDGDGDSGVLATLVRLTDRSLLQPVRDDVDEPRFVLLEAVRDHGRRQLDHDAVEAGGVRDRLVAWARERAATTAPLLAGAETVAALDELSRERPNILAALAIARAGDPATLVALHADLHLFWRHRGGTASAARDLRTALSSVTDPTLRQRGWCILAALAAMANEPAEARRAAMEALVLADGEGDREERALALNYLGWASILEDDLAGARSTLEEALIEAESRPLTWCASDILAGLGYVTHRVGRPAAGYQLLERALDVAMATGNQWMVVQARYMLAGTALADGRLALARREATLGAELARSLDDDAYLACHLSFLAATCVRAVDQPAAAQLVDEAHWRAAQSGWPWAERFALHAAATLAAGQGDARGLLRVWEHATAHEGPTARDAARACLALHEGDSAQAERFARDALRGADPASSPGPVIDTLEVLACTAERRGARERAAELRAAVAAARTRERYGRLAAEDDVFGPPHQEEASTGSRPLPEVVAGVLRGRRRRSEVTTGWSSLTATERYVVDLLLGGRSNARIAAEMRISVATVKSHLTHIYIKLGVGSRLELAQRAASDPPPLNPPTFG